MRPSSKDRSWTWWLVGNCALALLYVPLAVKVRFLGLYGMPFVGFDRSKATMSIGEILLLDFVLLFGGFGLFSLTQAWPHLKVAWTLLYFIFPWSWILLLVAGTTPHSPWVNLLAWGIIPAAQGYLNWVLNE